MKLNINNKANLPLKLIGEIYDKYLCCLYEDTLYENKVDYQLFTYKKKEYKMEVQYKISSINLTIVELNILAKKVTTKDIKMPKLPKKY